MVNSRYFRSLCYTCSLCRGVGFALFLVSIPLFIISVGAIFNGSAALVLPVLGIAVPGLLLMLLGDLLPLVMEATLSQRCVQEEPAKIVRQTDPTRD